MVSLETNLHKDYTFQNIGWGADTNHLVLSSVVLATGYCTSMARSSLKAGHPDHLEFVQECPEPFTCL